jgi:hypothetical protein
MLITRAIYTLLLPVVALNTLTQNVCKQQGRNPKSPHPIFVQSMYVDKIASNDQNKQN